MNFDTYIRDIPDFPKKGILFKDITTLLQDKKNFKKAIDAMAAFIKGQKIDYIVGVESRGFIFASALSYKLGCGFVPIRKPGKLPSRTYHITYSLEYGSDTLEIHRDAFPKNSRVLIVDDLLATGGTTQASLKLVKRLKGKIAGILFLIELSALGGRKKLRGYPVFSLITY